eukprot:371131_1
MSAPFANNVLLLIILYITISAYHCIECPKSSNCECIANEPCALNCIGIDYCKGSDKILTCKNSQPCIINCDGSTACQDATIEANNATKVTMNCTGGVDVCSGLTRFNCGTNKCNLNCDINSPNSCNNMVINVNTATSFECIGNCPANPSPFVSPTSYPTNTPTILPSKTPSIFPTNIPTNMPSILPSKQPSKLPSNYPTKSPTIN